MSYSKETVIPSYFETSYGKTPEEIEASVKRVYPAGRPRRPLILSPDKYVEFGARQLRSWRRPVIVRPFTITEILGKIARNPVEALRRLGSVVLSTSKGFVRQDREGLFYKAN